MQEEFDGFCGASIMRVHTVCMDVNEKNYILIFQHFIVFNYNIRTKLVSCL